MAGEKKSSISGKGYGKPARLTRGRYKQAKKYREDNPNLFNQQGESSSARKAVAETSAAKLNRDENRGYEQPSVDNVSDLNKNERPKDSFYRQGEDGKANVSSPKAKGVRDSSDEAGARRAAYNKIPEIIRNNKGKFAGGIIGIVLGGGLLTGGIFMSGPLQFLHVAELIGEIANTVHDIVKGGRAIRTLTRASSKAVSQSAKLANSRLNKVAQFWAKSYEKKLAKSGMRILLDEGGRFVGFEIRPDKVMGSVDNMAKKLGSNFVDLGKNLDDGWVQVGVKHYDDLGKGAARTSAFKNAMMRLSEISSDAPRAGPLMRRILGTKTLTVGFHPIHSVKAKKAVARAEKLRQFAEKRLVKQLAKKGIFSSGIGLKAKAFGKAAATVAKRVAGVIRGVITKVPVVGWIIMGISFVFELVDNDLVRKTALSAALGISMSQATELLAISDQIKYGDDGSLREPNEFSGVTDKILSALGVSSVYAEEEEGLLTLPEQLELLADLNFYRDDIDVVSPNSDEVLDNPDIAENRGTINSSFWQSTLVNAEIYGGLPEGDGKADTPPQLLANRTGKTGQQWMEDIVDAAIKAVGIGIGPKTFDTKEDFNPNSLVPRQMGSTVMYGARVTEKENMRTLGGNQLSAAAAAEIERERREIIATEFNEKPWYAKLFDVKDYKSGIVTLARDSGWNLNNRSLFNNLNNVAKTIFMAPKLLSKNFNRLATSPYAYNDEIVNWYGIGSFGFTNDQLDNLPEYDDAIVAVEAILNEKVENMKNLMSLAFGQFNFFSHFSFVGSEIILKGLYEHLNLCGGDSLTTTEQENCDSESFLDEILNKMIENCKNDFAIDNNSCALKHLSIQLPNAGLVIGPNSEIIPLTNSTGLEGAEKGPIDTYLYQDRDQDILLKSNRVMGKDTYGNDLLLGPSLQAYIMDYQIIVSDSAMMMDDSEEMKSALREIPNGNESEEMLNDSFIKLIGDYNSDESLYHEDISLVTDELDSVEFFGNNNWFSMIKKEISKLCCINVSFSFLNNKNFAINWLSNKASTKPTNVFTTSGGV